jgi:hypothetical protein
VAGIAKAGCAASGIVSVLDGADFLLAHASAATTDIATQAYTDGAGGAGDAATNTTYVGPVVGVETNKFWVYIDFAANINTEILEAATTALAAVVAAL